MGSDQFCLKWTNYQNNMVQALGRLKVSENLKIFLHNPLYKGSVNSSNTPINGTRHVMLWSHYLTRSRPVGITVLGFLCYLKFQSLMF
jgi:hypothetical protein